MSDLIQDAELLELLNALLEAERAGAKAARVFHRDHGDTSAAGLIDEVYRDEAWCCGMLTRWIEEKGGEPTENTGDFLQKVVAKEGLEARLAFLNRGQGWVVRKLEEVLPRVPDGELRADLQDMLTRHHTNIDNCAAFLDARG